MRRAQLRGRTGSWACARGVGEEFALADATADYKKMVTDFDDAGPLTRAAFMAQAYGVAVAPELGRFPASSACRPPGRRPRVQPHPDPVRVRAHAPTPLRTGPLPPTLALKWSAVITLQP